jgi:hypothetical protein
MISMMMWTIVPMLAAPQISTTAPPKCPVIAGIRAEAPPDPSANRYTGHWYISADRLIWAPAPATGAVQTFLGPYWVRPAGTQLTLTARRLDVAEPAITLRERNDYPTGFYWDRFELPTDGCWEVTATAGASELTFVADIRYSIERFLEQQATRVAWSREIGRIEEGTTRLVVTAVSLENPQSVTRSARAIRIDLTDGEVSEQFWREHRPLLDGTRRRLEEWASGVLPMFYNVGAVVTGDGAGLTLIHKEHEYSFPGVQRPAELARLLLQASEALSAQAP